MHKASVPFLCVVRDLPGIDQKAQQNRNQSIAEQVYRPLPDETGYSLLETVMNGIIYLVGLIVVVLAILSFLGLR